MRTHSLWSLNIFEGVRWYLETMSFLPVWPHTFVPSFAQEGQLSVTGESMCTKYCLTTYEV